jgi:hypothetical protein
VALTRVDTTKVERNSVTVDRYEESSLRID